MTGQRYISKPIGWVATHYDGDTHCSMTVHEQDDAPVRIGILDQNGHNIYRVKEKVRFGFVGREAAKGEVA